MSPGTVWYALLLSAGAGLATTVGSLLGLVLRQPGRVFIAFTLGFSAGVMVLVSFVELLPQAVAMPGIGFLGGHLAFLGGMAAYFLLDVLVPHDYLGQHDHRGAEHSPLLRAGLLVALGIGLHNFPEGLVTFAGALQDRQLGLAIAAAIALHNIPEGLAVSVPVYAATGSRRKAFLWSFLSGLSEPAGAAFAALFLLPGLDQGLLGWMLAAVAGIMVALSLDELLPAARATGSEHLPILGVIAGMGVMAASLWLFKVS